MLFNLLVLISSTGGSRIPLRTKIDFSVATTNDSLPLTAVTKNFNIEAADVLDYSMTGLKSVRANDPFRLCILCVLAVQSSTITL